MASQAERYHFEAPAEVVWAAVQRAAGQSGWAVSASQNGAIQLKIPPRGNCNAATLTAQVYPTASGADVGLSVSCYGVGLFMDGTLLTYIRTLHNLTDVQVKAMAAQAQAAKMQAPVADNPLLDSLERLARLHTQGHLTDEEYRLAKKQLLPAA